MIIKAAAGGGGKGMEIVRAPDEAERAFDAATRQGERYFADPAVYVERYVENPRHVEVQVLADAHGNVVHLGERDCTIQRRHQKLVEETPSPAVDDALRARIGQIAVDAARAAGYRSAGTVEGLLTPDGDYFFMEMNTRIQVEHTVTEAGHRPRPRPRAACDRRGASRSRSRRRDVVLRGHAIECRINAEDVTSGFLPGAGADHRLPRPGGTRRPRRLGRRGRGRGDRPLRPDDRQARSSTTSTGPRNRPDAPCPRGVQDRGHSDAPRVPPGAARAPVLSRRRDVRRRGRVARAGEAREADRGIVLSSGN